MVGKPHEIPFTDGNIQEKSALSKPTGGDIKLPESGMKFLLWQGNRSMETWNLLLCSFFKNQWWRTSNKQTKLSKSKSKRIKYSATKSNFVKLNRQVPRTKEGGAITINTLILSLLNLSCSINSTFSNTSTIYFSS